MDKYNHPLNLTLLKVLEEWAMMLVDPIEPSLKHFESDIPFFICTVNLRGVITGSVSIVCQHNFLILLANNILGDDEDAKRPLEECIDAFKEMGNVTCGNYITSAYGDDVIFDLNQPEVSDISVELVEEFIKRPVVFAYQADEIPILCSFRIG